MEVIITAVLSREFRLLQKVVKKSDLNEGGRVEDTLKGR